MNTLSIIAIAALGLGATIQYFFGMKKNRWIAKKWSAQTENAFTPKDTNYVNIGGTIGYNFVYKLREPWKEAKGAYTLFPRHSLLYMPVSLLIGGSDRFYMNIFTDRRLAGEGHIVSKAHLKKAKIDGIEAMKQEEVVRDGKTFILCWKGEGLKEALARTLAAMPDPAMLGHFCCFGENKTFYLFLRPRAASDIEPSLKAFLAVCPEYFR